jgi:hypothetical protein
MKTSIVFSWGVIVPPLQQGFKIPIDIAAHSGIAEIQSMLRE